MAHFQQEKSSSTRQMVIALKGSSKIMKYSLFFYFRYLCQRCGFLFTKSGTRSSHELHCNVEKFGFSCPAPKYRKLTEEARQNSKAKVSLSQSYKLGTLLQCLIIEEVDPYHPLIASTMKKFPPNAWQTSWDFTPDQALDAVLRARVSVPQVHELLPNQISNNEIHSIHDEDENQVSGCDEQLEIHSRKHLSFTSIAGSIGNDKWKKRTDRGHWLKQILQIYHPGWESHFSELGKCQTPPKSH
jgi:hypothetical protein